MAKLNDRSKVVVMLGFDCDRPRDAFIVSKEGSEMAERKINSIQLISSTLDHLKIPRTFFVCGHFLKSMNYKYGSARLKQAFRVDNGLVEIGDHSYSHNVLKKIMTRPDKIPMTPEKVFEEYVLNTQLFEEIFGISIPNRGYRTPLGHYSGLLGESDLLEKMKEMGVAYVSSDLRGPNDSINAPLTHRDGTPRQPYLYENGLLEIPAMGWQDVVFSPYVSHVAKFEDVPDDLPYTYDKIIEYYKNTLEQANQISSRSGRSYFFGLCQHPYDVSFYMNGGKFFEDLKTIVEELEGDFYNYGQVHAFFEEQKTL